MFRIIRPILLGLALVVSSSTVARSQYYYPGGYGYGGYGFGGWGGTAQGSILQGMGSYARGAGIYNYDSAVAGSINTDTAIRLNQYLYNSELEGRIRYNRHHAERLALDNAHYQAYQSRIRDNPTQADIDDGAALNTILDHLTDPKVMSGSGAGLRMADAKIPAASIRQIPFRDNTDAITISLDKLTDANSWPAPLLAPAFTPAREAYQKAVDDALAEDEKGGSIKPETVARVREAVARLSANVDETIPKTRQPDHLQAMNYVKGLAGLSRMLEKPNVEGVLADLEKMKDTSFGHLLAFMHSYNLRFGPATTPKEVAVYRDLYPTMLAQRDKILGKPGENQFEPSQATPVENPTEIFHGMDDKHLYDRGSNPGTPAAPVAPPAPTAPANPGPGTTKP